jgi:hypothetical protein
MLQHLSYYSPVSKSFYRFTERVTFEKSFADALEVSEDISPTYLAKRDTLPKPF